jgi:hypothetical protein
MLVASLYEPDGGWLKRIAGTLVQGISLGTLDAPPFAPATGYISFFTLALYISGLLLIMLAEQTETSHQLTLSSASETENRELAN